MSVQANAFLASCDGGFGRNCVAFEKWISFKVLWVGFGFNLVCVLCRFSGAFGESFGACN